MTTWNATGIKIIVALLIVLGTAGSCLSEPDKAAPTPAASVDGGRITETAGGFSYIPPAGWILGTGAPFNTLKYRGYVGDLDGGLKGALIAQDANSPKAFDAFVQDAIIEYQKQTPTPNVLSNTAFITNSGLQGAKVVLEITQNGALQRQVFYMFAGMGDQKRIVVAGWLASAGDRYEPVTDASMKTFTLVAPEEVPKSATPTPSTTPAPDATAPLLSSVLTYSNLPFDLSLTKLPANYNGNDSLTIGKAYIDNFTDKTEYETTDAYNARIQKAKTIPLVGSLTLQSPLAFQVDADDVTPIYDADHSVMQVNVDTLVNTGFELRNVAEPDGTYTGQNSFGTTVDVVKVIQRFAKIDMVNAGDFRFKWNTGMKEGTAILNVPMDATTAMLAKPNLRVLVVCQLSDRSPDVEGSYVAITSHHTLPKLDQPIDRDISTLYMIAKVNELVIYNVITGDIYQTIKSKSFK